VSEITYRQAVIQALGDELASDPSVVLLGEDVGRSGGVFKATEGLFERFGPTRIRDTPISEQAIVGSALGAAVCGLRPVAEIMFADFAGVCFDQLANQVAKHRYVTGGQVIAPLTVRFANGGGVGFGAQHSQSVENWFLNVPGVRICIPATPEDAYGLLRSAIQSDDPVLFFEHKALYPVKGKVTGHPIPLGRATVVRSGKDVTVVATQLMRHRALEAADHLASEGIDVELIDPRTLNPLDMDTLIESVEKTSRVVCVQECPAAGSWGATIVAALVETTFASLDKAPVLVSAQDTPIPYANSLEQACAERRTDCRLHSVSGAVLRLIRESAPEYAQGYASRFTCQQMD
jgi:pyruvate/2-oxoglutarate/acetoin dehydrogenase E1 component